MGRIPRAESGTLTASDSSGSPRQFPLFEFSDPPLQRSRVKLRGLKSPIWTENKAQLIERYLYYFVLITKHGAYIDGFAGPQDASQIDAWAARLVLESEPRWLRHFFLCDADADQYAALIALRDRQPAAPKGSPRRAINIYHADFNLAVADILASGGIGEKEAAFCLLDQRTFECHWATVERIARHKQHGSKVEIFYFLCAWWFDRAFHAIRNDTILAQWWGRSDWRSLASMNNRTRADALCERLTNDLGYKSALAWPIYSKADGGRIL